MTLLEAIDARISRRKYFPEPLDSAIVEQLKAHIAEYNRHDGVNMQLVLDNGTAFDGLSKSYGMFSGVRHYVGLIDRLESAAKPGKYSASVNTEKMGYYGELLMLNATALGLGTCWVGGTFDRKSCPFILAEGEIAACVITIGCVAEKQSSKERLIRAITHRKTKAIEQMYITGNPVPDWFMAGMRAVQKAPSAVNRQPVMFHYQNGMATASVDTPEDVGTALDLGIAKLHFELGAVSGSWQFGNGAVFTRE